MPLTAKRETERPAGLSISYSQINKDCDLKVRWHRQRVPRSNLGIFLVYGSALHRAVELYMKGVARTPENATKAAISYLDNELNAPQRQRLPLRWEDPPETTKDGTISRAKNQYGRIWCREAAVFWLRHQVPVWIERYTGRYVFLRTEHRLFIPMRPEPHWQNQWSFEGVLDLECEGDQILDLKSTGDPWDEQDVRKYSMQAHLYMGAYYLHYGRVPKFKFIVVPRCCEPDAYAPAPRIDEFEVEFDPDMTQRLINGVLRRKVNMIEAGIFPANPASKLCNQRFCEYHHHCIFGTGTHL